MIKNDKQHGSPFIDYTDTKANIQALTGVAVGASAYSTDAKQFGNYDGTIWQWPAAINWEYANAAARTGASGFVAIDKGKLALQLDNNSVWILTAITPTWLEINTTATGSGGGSIPIVTVDPVSPADGALWLLRETVAGIADGVPIGLLLALTYTGNSGATVPLKLSVNDDGTTRRLSF